MGWKTYQVLTHIQKTFVLCCIIHNDDRNVMNVYCMYLIITINDLNPKPNLIFFTFH